MDGATLMACLISSAVELHLSGRWLSESPIIRIGLALRLSIFLLYLYYTSLWPKIFSQFSHTHTGLCINVSFVRK